jgi:hypothetical protein
VVNGGEIDILWTEIGVARFAAKIPFAEKKIPLGAIKILLGAMRENVGEFFQNVGENKIFAGEKFQKLRRFINRIINFVKL